VLARGVVVLALLVFGLGATSAGRGPAERTVNCKASAAGTTPITISSGGLSRSAVVHVPPAGKAGHPLPLVLAFHGAGANGGAMESYSGLSGVSDRHGFVVAYPSATGPRGYWNIAGPRGKAPDDVQFAQDLISALEARLCLDPARIFATGVSNGGGMVARLGCELSGTLRAIAPVAGGYSSLPGCTPVRPISVLEIHGTHDWVVPYGGKGPARAGSARNYLRGWLARDHCPAHAARTVPARKVVRLLWAPCVNGTAVAHLKVIGGTHEWPESRPEQGDRSPAISASQAVWQFFASR
jgi:polyhydroxybutyrate depolymerase